MQSIDTTKGWYPLAKPSAVPDSNFSPGNDEPLAIVIHVMDDTLKSARSWFANPASRVSAHFGIDTDGTVVQFVSIYDTAQANGLSWSKTKKCWVDPAKNVLLPPHTPPWPLLTPPNNPNGYTLSIERAGHPGDVPTAAMDAATVALLVWLARQFPATLSPYRALYNLIGHRDIGPIHRANCPGPHVDLRVLAARANGSVPPPAAGTPAAIPVDARFRNSWTLSGGIWQANRLTPGLAVGAAVQDAGGVWTQRFERGVARSAPDGTVSWLLLSEIQR